MEKRRRARINNSLNDLKTLVLESMKKDVSIPYIPLILFLIYSVNKISHVLIKLLYNTKFVKFPLEFFDIHIKVNLLLSNGRKIFMSKLYFSWNVRFYFIFIFLSFMIPRNRNIIKQIT